MNKTNSIIAQLKIAGSNPGALVIGGACGALVPLGTSYVSHTLLHGNLAQLSVLPILVLGGLVFSCLSVYSFSRSVFGSWYKALGFVAAIEGYMTFTDGWLSITALVFLIAINAIANGCRVACERQAELDAIETAKAETVSEAAPVVKFAQLVTELVPVVSAEVAEVSAVTTAKRRGRPVGSKNKTKRAIDNANAN